MQLVMYVNGKPFKKIKIQYVGITSYKAKEQYHQLLAKELLSHFQPQGEVTFFVEGIPSRLNSMSMEEIEKMTA